MENVVDGDRVKFRTDIPYRGQFRNDIGVATGETTTNKYPEGRVRAEVKWSCGRLGWPILDLLEKA